MIVKPELKKICWAAALFALTLTGGNGASAQQASEKTISIVADEWCPYNCTPDSDAPGILIEIAQKAFEKEGIKVKYSILPWTRAIEEARQGKHHAIVGAAVADAPDFVFPSTPQFRMRNAFYTNLESTWEYKGPTSLKDVSLGVIRDYTYSDEIDIYITENQDDLTKIQVAAGEDALATNIKKLLGGRMTVLVEDKNVIEMFLKDNPEYQGKLRLAGYIEDTPDNDIHVAFSPGNEDSKRYAEIMAQETKRLIESGEIKEILAHYLGETE
jgi:polar amino acid transport system substrate-binding protein